MLLCHIDRMNRFEHIVPLTDKADSFENLWRSRSKSQHYKPFTSIFFSAKAQKQFISIRLTTQITKQVKQQLCNKKMNRTVIYTHNVDNNHWYIVSKTLSRWTKFYMPNILARRTKEKERKKHHPNCLYEKQKHETRKRRNSPADKFQIKCHVAIQMQNDSLFYNFKVSIFWISNEFFFVLLLFRLFSCNFLLSQSMSYLRQF